MLKKGHFCSLISRILAGLLPVCTVLCLAACTTATKYEKVDSLSSPIIFALKTQSESVTVNLHAVIVTDAPGSWKKRALWDEYVLSITNNRSEAITLNQPVLTDHLGGKIEPGNDPWELEKRSSENWKHYGEQGLSLAIGGMGTVLLADAIAAGATSSLEGALIDAAFSPMIPYLAAVGVVSVQGANYINRREIQAEFTRRSLVLPATIRPGEMVAGCLFFPQTPGPQNLSFAIASDKSDTQLNLKLTETPLGSLHLKPEKVENNENTKAPAP
ncbi:hypothetical protein [Pelagicoccus mobilis]|uniref:Lipoprotein n=1 Tax=Pelagicoccus mobilis TaxID=415221 RepID=A0A934VQW0_9BACT|nr:hypothetical protein [Pelagicoccus mobilis]MBK1878752.1 hypothetical protein [Pelagicoccus mobilis]